MDEFVAERHLRVDATKIDVDTFDLEVLRGAERTLNAQDPYVMVELNHALSVRQQSVPEVLRLMVGLGYDECESYDYENFLCKRESARRAPGAGITIRFPGFDRQVG
jgi:hypothetical protein